MKITIEEKKIEREWAYPCLVVDEDGEVILGIRDDGKDDNYFSGIIIRSTERPIGQYGSAWYKPYHKLFIGKVTFENI